MDKFIVANLNHTITFIKGNQEVVIPVDSIIHVYPEEGFAVWHTIYFEVFADEYSLTA